MADGGRNADTVFSVVGASSTVLMGFGSSVFDWSVDVSNAVDSDDDLMANFKRF